MKTFIIEEELVDEFADEELIEKDSEDDSFFNLKL
jgi:hypothetical protein